MKPRSKGQERLTSRDRGGAAWEGRRARHRRASGCPSFPPLPPHASRTPSPASLRVPPGGLGVRWGTDSPGTPPSSGTLVAPAGTTSFSPSLSLSFAISLSPFLVLIETLRYLLWIISLYIYLSLFLGTARCLLGVAWHAFTMALAETRAGTALRRWSGTCLSFPDLSSGDCSRGKTMTFSFPFVCFLCFFAFWIILPMMIFLLSFC